MLRTHLDVSPGLGQFLHLLIVLGEEAADDESELLDALLELLDALHVELALSAVLLHVVLQLALVVAGLVDDRVGARVQLAYLLNLLYRLHLVLQHRLPDYVFI